jgi:hypothetical protein
MNTLERCILAATAAAALIAPVWAQSAERRANLTGGGNDSGKCTIEVVVDGAADVEIRGDRGFLRTISGQPAQWRRFECSGPIPANPAEFRFSGVDGRGRQELVQDPRRAGGAAVVRIQDSNGGAEAYTFDLVWRGSGVGSNPAGQPWGGRERGGRSNDGARACQDAVRERANQQFGLRDIEFRDLNVDDNPGSNDRVVGWFDARRGGDRNNSYRFSCSVDLNSGRVRGVEINQGRDTGRADRYSPRDEANSACRRAAEQRIERDGYRNVQVSSLDADTRRNDWITGSATAQRGNNGRGYDFDIGCSVDPNNGSVRSVQVKQR